MDNIRVRRHVINKLNDQNIYVVDNLISLNEILWLYHKLISSFQARNKLVQVLRHVGPRLHP